MAKIRSFRRLLQGVAILSVATIVHGSGPAPADVPNDTPAILHTLNRIAFGPRPGDVDRVREMGLENYIEQQLHPERMADDAMDARLAPFTTLTLSSQELSSRYFLPALEMRRQVDRAKPDAAAPAMADPATPDSGQTAKPKPTPEMARAQADVRLVTNEIMQARLLRAAMSERQLQEVLTDFWFNHFNVFIGKSQVRQYLTEYERDVIRPNVFGSFRELLGDVAQSPAMLLYLDNWQSAGQAERPEMDELQRRLTDSQLAPAARQRLTERLQRAKQAARPARGLNENYARELMELHTLGVDGGYTQQDVVALARILTGWTIDQPRQGGAYIFRDAIHDSGTKTLLGKTFASTGEAEGKFALDLLASHPATARHIAFKLAQRFVADEPPPALVERVAGVFLSTKGDLREVVRSVITSPEFFAEEHRRAKVKTPLEFVVSSVRITGATLTSAQPLIVALQNLGMPLFGCQPPTGYSMTAANWVNTGALINRMNFAMDLVGGRVTPQRGRGASAQAAPVRQNRPGRGRPTPGPIQIDLAAHAPDLSDATRTRLTKSLLGGTVSDATRETMARAETPEQLVALALGSPEFQRR